LPLLTVIVWGNPDEKGADKYVISIYFINGCYISQTMENCPEAFVKGERFHNFLVPDLKITLAPAKCTLDLGRKTQFYTCTGMVIKFCMKRHHMFK
jgi:hypothetical protein